MRYAGNKQNLMGQIRPFFNWSGIKRYLEPFCGALGAYINAGVPENVEVWLNDGNRDLINYHQQILSNRREVEEIVGQWPVNAVTFYAVRQWDRNVGWAEELSKASQAARIQYLSSYSFNGIMRYNGKGHFNAPFNGSQRIAPLPHYHFKNQVKFSNDDFSNILAECGEGDLIYADPPYLGTGGLYYTAFTQAQQLQLRDLLLEANQRGAKVVASNSWEAVELYHNFNVEKLTTNRRMNCKVERRGRTDEMLVWRIDR